MPRTGRAQAPASTASARSSPSTCRSACSWSSSAPVGASGANSQSDRFIKVRLAILSSDQHGRGFRYTQRGTVISFMGGEQVYIVVSEQPEEIIKPKSEPTEIQKDK